MTTKLKRRSFLGGAAGFLSVLGLGARAAAKEAGFTPTANTLFQDKALERDSANPEDTYDGAVLVSDGTGNVAWKEPGGLVAIEGQPGLFRDVRTNQIIAIKDLRHQLYQNIDDVEWSVAFERCRWCEAVGLDLSDHSQCPVMEETG